MSSYLGLHLVLFPAWISAQLQLWSYFTSSSSSPPSQSVSSSALKNVCAFFFPKGLLSPPSCVYMWLRQAGCLDTTVLFQFQAFHSRITVCLFSHSCQSVSPGCYLPLRHHPEKTWKRRCFEQGWVLNPARFHFASHKWTLRCQKGEKVLPGQSAYLQHYFNKYSRLSHLNFHVKV